MVLFPLNSNETNLIKQTNFNKIALGTIYEKKKLNKLHLNSREE